MPDPTDGLRAHWLLDNWGDNRSIQADYINLYSVKYLRKIVFRPKAEGPINWGIDFILGNTIILL